MKIKKYLYSILYRILHIISKLVVWRFKPQIIAITGSAGKTSAKEATWSILRAKYRTRKSVGNFNNELGVPLAILGGYKRIWHPLILFWGFVIIKGFLSIFLPKRFYPEILILEYGADKSGDMAKLVNMARPYIGAVTSIGDIPVHVEFYPSGVGAVIKEKAKLISRLSVNNFAILNFDDKNTYNIREKTRAKVIGFGFSPKSDFKISNFSHIVEGDKIMGINFKIEKNGAMIPIHIKNVFSIGHAYSATLAIAIADNIGINIIEAAEILSNNYIPVNGRSIIVSGIKNTQIIDESYNSSPIALKLSLFTIMGVDFCRRVGILGDMAELGGFTQKAHEKIGRIVPESFDVLITIGEKSKYIAKSAIKNGMSRRKVFVYSNAEDAMRDIKNIIKKDDLIFIKGSRIVGLDKLVELLKLV